MQSVAPEGRSVVSVSSTGAISIDARANTLGQAGSARDSRGSADVGNVLKEIMQAFDGLFNSSVQPAAISQGPVLFSAKATSSADSLNGIGSTLDGISQKLSALVNAPQSAVPNAQPASTSASPQPNADWPFPDLGANPFMDHPTGSGPSGSFAFNPTYFPTEATAETIAHMLGGKVVPQNVMLTAPGSPFGQNQPNYMVELPNGNVINPGFIAQAIDSKQPRNTIDAVIYSEVNNTPIAIGQAPHFVPPAGALPSPTSTNAPAASTVSMPSTGWSSLDQMKTHAYRALASDQAQSDDATVAMRDRVQSLLKMLQLLSRLVSIQEGRQSNSHIGRAVTR